VYVCVGVCGCVASRDATSAERGDLRNGSRSGKRFEASQDKLVRRAARMLCFPRSSSRNANDAGARWRSFVQVTKGGRQGYFRDDKVTLEELVRREAEGADVRARACAVPRPDVVHDPGMHLGGVHACVCLGAQDMDAIYAENIMRAGHKYKADIGVRALARARAGPSTRLSSYALVAVYVQSRAGMDEDEFIDAKLLEKKETRFTARKQQATDLQRAVAADKRATATTARCWWCPESRERKAHLVIAEGARGVMCVRVRVRVCFVCVFAPLCLCVCSCFCMLCVRL
jgi:hypothetical protein